MPTQFLGQSPDAARCPAFRALEVATGMAGFPSRSKSGCPVGGRLSALFSELEGQAAARVGQPPRSEPRAVRVVAVRHAATSSAKRVTLTQV